MLSSLRRIVFVSFLASSLGMQIAAAESVEISFPATGAVINVGTLMWAMLDSSVDPSEVQSVSFEYSSDLSNWYEISEPAPDGYAKYAANWNVGSLTPGVYYLRAKLVDTSNVVTYSSTVNVQVNAQPVARAVASPTFTPFTVHYDATSSFDPDGSIVSYDWDFGDGTIGTGPVIDHQFPGPGAYGIAMTVTDNEGGTSTRHTILALTAQGFFKEKAKNTCGCKKMTVKSDDDVDAPKGFDFSRRGLNFPAAEETKLGPYQLPGVGNQLDFDKDAFDVRFRFEVIADLKDFSKPQLCEQGQRVQRVATDDGKPVKKNGNISKKDPRYDSSKSPKDPFDSMKENGKGDCGPGDANWCDDDDYHGGGNARGAGSGNNQPGNARYDDEKRIVWLDAPGVRDLPKTEIENFGWSATFKFEAAVSGPNTENPDCKCAWDVIITVDKTGKVTDNKLQGLACLP